MRRAIPGAGRSWGALLICLSAAACPQPPAPPPPAPHEGPTTGTSQVARPALEPWELIPPSRAEALGWPLLTAVAHWPDPQGLTPLIEAAPIELVRSEQGKNLLSLAMTLLSPEFSRFDPQADLGVDDQRRVHLRVKREQLSGSLCLAAHEDGFPTLTLALKTGQRAASSIAELRQQVADVLNDDLRAELSREEFRLDPHDAFPNAGLAQLNQESGYGAQFPFLYAYSGRGTLVLVFQEVPHAEEGE